MNLTELAELLLLKVYDVATKQGFSTEVSLDEVAKEFGENDEFKVFQIGKTLEARNLIHGLFRKGETSAILTGEGALFIEQKGETGIIEKYQKNPTTYIYGNVTNIHNVKDSNISANSSHLNQEIVIINDWDKIIASMVEIIRNDRVIGEDKKSDALADIETLKVQLRKKSKSKDLIKMLLGNLGDISSIASLVIQLTSSIHL